MTHKEKLLEIYQLSSNISDIDNIPKNLMVYIDNITENIDRNKGVYTVLITLLTHKLLIDKQDIRYFQTKMKNGFSGRSIDTKYITPTLKELGLPSMAESGWLTRSLEQDSPYTLQYKGAISGNGVRDSFLIIIDAFQKKSELAKNILRIILNIAIKNREKNKVKIKKIKNSDEITILNIIKILDEHFSEKYKIHGGSKLPVLAFFGVYEILINELTRYKNCELAPLGSHTACDTTSKSAGDIEIVKNTNIFEAIEIKLDKQVDSTITRIAYEKIVKFNPERYYILSNVGILEDEEDEIIEIVERVKNEHGCQIIINGLLPTIKYYLRLISDPKEFFNNYIDLVKNDKELKVIHKQKLRTLIKEHKI